MNRLVLVHSSITWQSRLGTDLQFNWGHGRITTVPLPWWQARAPKTPKTLIRVIRETHTAPDRIRDLLARAGGCNRFCEPHFRVVWGGARLTWVGGRWTDRDAHGNVLREMIETVTIVPSAPGSVPGIVVRGELSSLLSPDTLPKGSFVGGAGGAG